MRTILLGGLALAGFALPLQAQAGFGNEWLEFVSNPGSLAGDPLGISNPQTEVDFDWGDLDQDGWTDLVVVRKQPFTTLGKRTNLLLMNRHGVLVDETRDFAVASDFPGDLGFQTPTNDRDVVLVDVDGDGWLDVVTATTMSMGDPKVLGHPRVYRNLGADASGNWQGIKFEEARFPQLLHMTSGLPFNPRFCSVDAGDVTGNGFPDLYFGDYDGSEFGFTQPESEDLNDRLIVNDGTGFFTDDSATRMSATMLDSAFGMAVEIADMNGDGALDIVKDTALNPPQYISVSYNNPTNEGFYNLFDDFHQFEPYHFDVGDLNNDGRLDIVVSDDSIDRYRLNQGNDPLGRVIWGAAKTYLFLTGGDDGFAGNNLIVDLDGDGWNDVIYTDEDVDIAFTPFNRTHIYHNLGGVVGGDVELGEERELPGDGGWLGAMGLYENRLRDVHDVAVFDLDNDGDMDMILGRKVGTSFWINQTVRNSLFTDVATISLGSGGDQVLTLDAGTANAGLFYWLLGSMTGTEPGVPIGSEVLPLVQDVVFAFTFANPNTPPYHDSQGLLDADGRATTTISLPPGTLPGLVGTTLFHAYGVQDQGTGQVTLASNPMVLFLSL
ncbi:MAG: VCBS repeat-containing protein [Planctomycetota bacterium]|nr:VCBS repeat-containing protein [Planctomycetota bacterium]